jgi:putative transposase
MYYMPRGPRLDAPDALYHVMARAIERRRLFHDDHDRADFLTRLGRVAQAAHSPVYAWCLMPNHFHLLLRRGTAALPSMMRRLLTGYAVAFNHRHHRTGHLLQNRFKSILVQEDPYLLELLRYIHLNPVRARLIVDLDELERYPWTGHAVLRGRRTYAAQDTTFILEQFGRSTAEARRAYQQFVRAGLEQGARPELDGGGLRRSQGRWHPVERVRCGRERWTADERLLGSSEFVHAVLQQAAPPPRPLAARSAIGPVLTPLLQTVAARCGLSAAALASNSRRRPVVAARALVSQVAVERYALSPTHVADALGVSRQTVLYGVAHASRLLARQHWSLDALLP